MEFGASTAHVTWGKNTLKVKIPTFHRNFHFGVWDEQAFVFSHELICANLKENSFHTNLAQT